MSNKNSLVDENKTPEPARQLPEIEADLPLPSPPAGPPPPKPAAKKPPPAGSRWQRLRDWYSAHKKLSIPLSVLILLLIILAIPASRYGVAGLALKKNFVIAVKDATTNAPVSGALVSAGSISDQTDGSGKATLKLKPGNRTVTVSKKYYREETTKVMVPLLQSKSTPEIKLQATGRQVQISVKNSITKKALPEVNIKVADIDAKTDKDGSALIVLPAGSASQKAALSLSGYNDTDVTVKVSDAKVEENEFTLAPTGKIYFLSKLSGKIDVVKSNLDGTGRETVLAGTGREDSQNTVLLANRDWKYLALLSRRDSDLAKLYLIETGNDKITAIDEGNATFNPLGWSGAYFVYQVDRKGYQPWQPKQHVLKSYDVAAKKTNLLDETGASGSSSNDAKYEFYSSTYIVGQRLVFSKAWYMGPGTEASDDNQLGIYSVSATGNGGKATHKTFSYQADKSTYEQSFLNKPDQVYFQVTEKDGEAKYFVYANNQVSENPSVKDDFNNNLNSGQYITYLLSPSGGSTFWSESRDGKNSLFIGDGVGGNAKQIAKLSEYETYGWYTEDYLLVSKNSSELYIFGTEGLKKDDAALKITDYHKPDFSYYGGGYGGL
ncbi:carboxypeptidase regulatory-like domain-containing protein [Candidatus Saccharibacteria bacterium]|nr:carboxypeptidase regulatory-like domain-containing protein [Candidatus Saccharibacteria bacterium]